LQCAGSDSIEATLTAQDSLGPLQSDSVGEVLPRDLGEQLNGCFVFNDRGRAHGKNLRPGYDI
jgi:hypothetical protein